MLVVTDQPFLEGDGTSPGTRKSSFHANVWTHYNGGMNITFSLDDQLISAAKLVAAKHDTSISALVRTSLEHQVALDNEATSSGASGVLQELIDYSMGRRPRAVTMAVLGIDDYGVLLRLLNAAQLPHPLIPLAKRQAMAAGMAKAIRSSEQKP